MSSGNTISIIGLTVVLVYVICQILNFYGVSPSSYGIYLCFYIFIVLCVLIFPKYYKND
jgi:uncharacterized membrane protein YtjA (UPF0391 family)